MTPRLTGFLRGRVVAVLGTLFLAGMAGMLVHFERLQHELVASVALDNARLYSRALSKFRTLYTSEVVERARANGTRVTHDYAEHPGAIPLPATLSMLLGNRLGEGDAGVSTRLYSPYPFPWVDDGGLRDAFARAAWERLEQTSGQSSSQSFYRFEDYLGRPSLRYATADVMRSACVDCHNSHPSSPKTDWREGDLRGVLEVVYPLGSATDKARAGVRQVAGLMVVIFLLALGVFGMSVAKQRRTTRDLEERVRVQAELEEAKEQAESANHAKGEFLANVSHELRTPLHGILGFAGMGIKRHERMSPAKALTYFESIETSGTRLLGLVESLLEFAELESGDQTVELRQTDPDALIGQVVEEFRAQYPERRFTGPESSGTRREVLLDPKRIRQVVRKLLANALRFSPGGGAIEIESRVGQDTALVTVRDHGVGVPEEELENIFDRFVQSTRTKTGAGGTGLGLSICREIIAAHGGRIWAEAQPGFGGVFCFEIPVKPEQRSSGSAVRAATSCSSA